MNARSSLALALGAAIASLSIANAQATVTYQSALEYDELGRVIRVLAADGSVKFRYAYDAVGNRTASTDALGRTTTFAYDALGRMVASIDPLGGRAMFTYDAADRITQIVDPRGIPTRYHYDGMGRLVREESQDRGHTTYTYDQAGQLLHKTLADGTTLTHEYDTLGRLTRQGSGDEWRTHVYDACANGKGRWCESLTAATQTRVDYTQAGQIELKRERIGEDENQTAFAWDHAGRLAGIAYPSGTFVGYRYAAGKLESVYATVAGETVPVIGNITSSPFGGATGWDYGNGLQRTIHLDLDGRVAGLGVADASGARQSLTYQRNAADEITRITNGVDGALTLTNGFDATSRLTSSHAPARQSDFTLDLNGNRTAYREGDDVFAIQVDPNSNRVLGASGAKQSSLEYDANGNLVRLNRIGDADTRFVYDGFQRLLQVSRMGAAGSVETNYLTNAIDQRVQKGEFNGATRFTYMGQNQLLAERTPSGWKDYIRVGESLVGMVNGQTDLYFAHDDQLGRPEVLTDAGRNVRWRAANHAFNREVKVDAVGGMSLGFPGQYWDEESRTWFNGFRYYLSEVEHGGRYTQPDPIGLGGGMNPYTYVGSNPTDRVDVLGLRATCRCSDTGAEININFDFDGPGATPEVIASWRSSIEQAWSAPGFKVTTSIGGWWSTDITFMSGRGRSFMQGNRGTWFAEEDPWTAAHESGHIMRLDDRYVEVERGITVPQEGWQGTIMAEHLGTVTATDRQAVMDALGCNCPCGDQQ